jgi:acyl carrier protein
MSELDIRAKVIDALKSVAPECDPSSIDAKASLRESLDLDSMDFLNFVIAVNRSLRIDIPEADYAKVQSLESAVAYLQGRVAGRPG